MREIEVPACASPVKGLLASSGVPRSIQGWGAADPRERVLGSRGPPDTLDPTVPPCLGSSRAARRGRIVGPRRELGSDQSVWFLLTPLGAVPDRPLPLLPSHVVQRAFQQANNCSCLHRVCGGWIQ